MENNTTKKRVWESFKDVIAQPEIYTSCKPCDFYADDGKRKKRVYLAEVCGLDWTAEHRNTHVNLSLYYDTHYAMTIGFATKKDAWEYVESKGKIDRRIESKQSRGGGWALALKGEMLKTA